MEIGKIREFKVISSEENGHYITLLEHEGDDAQDIFMPHLRNNSELSHELKVDDIIEAFVYHDDNGGLVASQLLPDAEVEEFALLKVVDSQPFGAFLDWGLEKDLFVPAKKQKKPMQVGELYLVRVCYDRESGKIYGTTKFDSMLATLDFDIRDGDQVEVIPAEEHELGYRCIVNRRYIGMIYHNEIFEKIKLDREYEGHIKKIREDGLIDLSLQVQGIKGLDAAAKKILEFLKKNGGKLKLHDKKSSPEQIKQVLGMSKKTFKSSVGMLYKARKIVITDDGIELTK